MGCRLPPFKLREPNDYVFRDILNMAEDEISGLEKEKIIGGNRYVWA